MKTTFVLILSILSLMAYEEKGSESVHFSQNSIVIDKLLIDAIERDAASIYNAVLLAGDTILVPNDVEIHGISLIVICEQWIAKGTIKIHPHKIHEDTLDAKKNGRNGSSITIYSKSKVDGTFILSGGHGADGLKGDDGESGSKEFKKDELSRHPGKPGKNGENGGNGGNGGDLKIFTLQTGSEITFESIGGNRGLGGDFGRGGVTYTRRPMYPENEPVRPGIAETVEDNGVRGEDGKRGANGKRTVNVVSENSFATLIKKYGFKELKSDSSFMRVELMNIGNSPTPPRRVLVLENLDQKVKQD